MMFANYHTHTARCHHAGGTEREYIEKALEAGISVLGFSDHVPYPFPKNFYSNFRMRLQEADDYVATLSALRTEYQSDIQILIGFEAEYYPDLFSSMLDDLQPYPYEYLILGQHFLENEMSGLYSGTPTNQERILQLYVDQTIAGMKTGKFTYLAHPDLLHFTGSPEIYRRHMTRLCVCALEMGMPLEINHLGLSDHRSYPDGRFFQIAAEIGNTVIRGCDAHNPAAMNDQATFALSKNFAAKYQLHLVDQVRLINPKS
ncbi:MAG: histidinol-phosphatase [Clostridiaceae bacterium]|nr:histidinol-phosphatase [Clostridiaceae bacterium]